MNETLLEQLAALAALVKTLADKLGQAPADPAPGRGDRLRAVGRPRDRAEQGPQAAGPAHGPDPARHGTGGEEGFLTPEKVTNSQEKTPEK
jgi:hypothetical protein